MNKDLSWRDLEILNAVLEEGNFSNAAKLLGTSQPTVSRHIDRLENKLEKELFTRTNSGLEPTKLARHLGTYTAQIGDNIHAIHRALNNEEEIPAGIVTVSLPHGWGTLPVMEALTGFHTQYPDVCVSLLLGPPQNNLGRREADIDLRWERPAEPNVVAKSIGSYYMGFYAAQSLMDQYGMPSKPTDLNNMPWPRFQAVLHEALMTQAALNGITPSFFPFACENNSVFSMLLGRLGKLVFVNPIGLQGAGAIRLLPQCYAQSPDFWLAMHSSLRRNARIRLVWEWLALQLPPIFAATKVGQQERTPT